MRCYGFNQYDDDDVTSIGTIAGASAGVAAYNVVLTVALHVVLVLCSAAKLVHVLHVNAIGVGAFVTTLQVLVLVVFLQCCYCKTVIAAVVPFSDDNSDATS